MHLNAAKGKVISLNCDDLEVKPDEEREKEVKVFQYLRSVVCKDESASEEIINRIGKANGYVFNLFKV